MKLSTEVKYFTDRNIAERYGIGRSTVWYWLSKNQLPQPVKLNGTTRWRLCDLQEWEENCNG